PRRNVRAARRFPARANRLAAALLLSTMVRTDWQPAAGNAERGADGLRPSGSDIQTPCRLDGTNKVPFHPRNQPRSAAAEAFVIAEFGCAQTAASDPTRNRHPR